MIINLDLSDTLARGSRYHQINLALLSFDALAGG